MTAKEYVLSKVPTARAEKQKGNGPFGKTYWLIREKGAYMYIAPGDTERKAWKAAMDKIKAEKEAGK